jgi:regulator of protease activity HflC (stomatin/prohibitin superfamily)
MNIIMMNLPLGFAIVAGAFFLFLFVLLIKSVYLVRQAEVIVIERLGRYDRTLGAGLHIVLPFLERPRTTIWTYLEDRGGTGRYYRYVQTLDRIDLRESVYDFPKQNVITKDNVTTEINALLYYQITDPKAALYEVNNLPEAIEKLTQTTLRDVIGSMDLDETLVSRAHINERLRLILDEATDKWGVKVNRVELQEVNPPHDIRVAMEKQMRAERDRRATILESEGKKRAAILEAEGVKESKVLRATGEAESVIIAAESEAQARLKAANAEAKAIELVSNAIQKGDPLPYLIAMQYIKILPEITKGGEGKTVVIPYDASSVIGSLASIKQIFEQIK